jgi:predicted N-acetyltransferase YhbS
MLNNVKISPLKTEDTEELVKLVNSAYRGESSKQGWTTEADLLDGIRADRNSIEAQLQVPGSTILVAKNDEAKMIGCVYLLLQGYRLYLGMLTVAPHLQSAGIGSRLLFSAEEFGRDNQCSSIIMTVIDIRHELIDWYKRKGYVNTGETKPFPKNDPSFGIPNQPLRFIVLEKKI